MAATTMAVYASPEAPLLSVPPICAAFALVAWWRGGWASRCRGRGPWRAFPGRFRRYQPAGIAAASPAPAELKAEIA